MAISELMRKLTSPELVDEALSSELAIVLKHSTACPISRNAQREVALFMSQHPEIPVYIVDILQNRDISQYIEKRTGVAHQSPQALVVKDGKVTWHDSHYRIEAASLNTELA